MSQTHALGYDHADTDAHTRIQMHKVIKKKPFRGLEAQLKQKYAWLAHSFLDPLTEVSLPSLRPPPFSVPPASAECMAD